MFTVALLEITNFEARVGYVSIAKTIHKMQ